MHEVDGPIERIDDPAEALVIPHRERLLGDDMMLREPFAKPTDDEGLGGVIDLGDEIYRRLAVDSGGASQGVADELARIERQLPCGCEL